jgi:hypothetical protein
MLIMNSNAVIYYVIVCIIPIVLDRMKKHSMLVGGCLIVGISIYGFIIACIFTPTSVALIAMALVTIALVIYI